MKTFIALVLAVFLWLGSASFSRADHVVFHGDVVDRSSIAMESENVGGKLVFKITWGHGLVAKTAQVNYNESYGSPEHMKAILKLASLLNSKTKTVFGEADISTEIGLTLQK